MKNKEQSKEEIIKLVQKYERLRESRKVKSSTEEKITKKDFILPLFGALEWNEGNFYKYQRYFWSLRK